MEEITTLQKGKMRNTTQWEIPPLMIWFDQITARVNYIVRKIDRYLDAVLISSFILETQIDVFLKFVLTTNTMKCSIKYGKIPGIFNGNSSVRIVLRHLPFVSILLRMELDSSEWINFVFHTGNELETPIIGVGGEDLPLLGETVVGEVGWGDAPPGKQMIDWLFCASIEIPSVSMIPSYSVFKINFPVFNGYPDFLDDKV